MAEAVTWNIEDQLAELVAEPWLCYEGHVRVKPPQAFLPDDLLLPAIDAKRMHDRVGVALCAGD